MERKKKLLLIITVALFNLLGSYCGLQAQSLGLNNTNPDASSILDATATDRGVLVPRMTTAQRNAIVSPAKSLMVFDTDLNLFYYNSGTSGSPAWVSILNTGSGWHGSQTRIKILPSDFQSNKSNPDKFPAYDNNGTNKGMSPGHSNNSLFAFIAIPTGYKATHARIYGSSTDNVNVYESDISTGTWSASKGNAATGTEIDITDVNSSTTNFLVLEIQTNNANDIIYGGYVTIAIQ